MSTGKSGARGALIQQQEIRGQATFLVIQSPSTSADVIQKAEHLERHVKNIETWKEFSHNPRIEALKKESTSV
jgi:hypothetical protein